jgi:hypothetical protein
MIPIRDKSANISLEQFGEHSLSASGGNHWFPASQKSREARDCWKAFKI